MSAVPESRPLNVVCRRADLELILEGQFIRAVLLGGLARPVRWITVEAGQPWPLLNDSLLLVLGMPDAYTDYLDGCRDAGFANVGILHMADEKGLVDCGFYARARYVLRNY